MTELPEIEQPPQQPVTIRTLWHYLCGRREAILQLVSCRHTVWLGLLFVISAGFAREYDQEDLLHDPWYLAIPLVASLATSFLLFCMIFRVAKFRKVGELPFFKTYRSFLGLYWMTALLAWLYAIPVEGFLSAAHATEANLWLLGIVATWRVVLMIRIVIVLFDSSKITAIALVMFFADTFLLVLLFAIARFGFLPSELFNVMGGIQMSDSQRLIKAVYGIVLLLGIVSLPVWLVSLELSASNIKMNWNPPAFLTNKGQKLNRGYWFMAFGAIAIWIFILPITQPKQRLAREVTEVLSSGNIEEGFQLMSDHGSDGFPPLWNPPPRLMYGEKTPDTLIAMETILKNYPESWFREIYEEKFLNPLRSRYEKANYLERFSEAEMHRFMEIFTQLSQSKELVARSEETWIHMACDERFFTESTRQRLREMLIGFGVDSEKIKKKQKELQNQKKKQISRTKENIG